MSFPKRYDYNLIIFGAGPAGLVAAYLASLLKAKVALIEKHKMGGDCLNTGCVPSKAIIRSAKIANYFKRCQEFGIKTGDVEIDFVDVMNRIRRIIGTIEPHDSVERFKKLGVDCFVGDAKIESPNSVRFGDKLFTTRSLMISTGAYPLIPKIENIEQVPYLTTDTIWNLNHLPKRFLVIGGGTIGCELAQSFARLGSQVTIVERSPTILAREDEEVAELMMERFQQEGVQILAGHQAQRFHQKEGQWYLQCKSGERLADVPFDDVFISLGRKARVEGFGLEELGIKLTPRGNIDVDEYLRTNYPNIYAAGDVAGPYQFTHTAGHQARYAVMNALFSPFRKSKVDYKVVPWCTYTDPEIARVGINEREAIERKIRYEATTYKLNEVDRAIVDDEPTGFIRVLTAVGSDKILGVTIVGARAGEWISEYILAMKYNLGLRKILNTMHIYPTLSEANRGVAAQWRQNRISTRFFNWMEKFHRARR